MGTVTAEIQKERTEFEKGLLAAIHDYVTNYPDEIPFISKEVMDQISYGLLSDFTFELTYAKKSALGGYFSEHIIYCNSDTAAAYIKEADHIGTAVEVKPNPHVTKEFDIMVPSPTIGAYPRDYFPSPFLSRPLKK